MECVSSDFTLASCLSFISEMEHMLCSSLCVSNLRFLYPNQSCYENALASQLKNALACLCAEKVLNTTKQLLQNKQEIFSIQMLLFFGQGWEWCRILKWQEAFL